jgi:predicted metal-dependent hydrolase
MQSNNMQCEVIIDHKAGLRRMSLRFHPLKRAFVLSAPKRTARVTIDQFIARHTPHMHSYVASLPDPVKLAHGTIVPILGEDHIISPTQHSSDSHLPCLIVLATPANCGTSARATLQQILLNHINTQVHAILSRSIFHGINHPDITLRDTVSRWGSCSTSGKMMFSWRLVFAPQHVVDYVIAHECAHLLHHNHSAAFWELTRMLHPDIRLAKEWLRHYHQVMFRYIT